MNYLVFRLEIREKCVYLPMYQLTLLIFPLKKIGSLQSPFNHFQHEETQNITRINRADCLYGLG